jgi:hypothetical protein
MSQTVQQTADAILALINSKPKSPTMAEIVAIIVKAMPAPDVGDYSREEASPAPGVDSLMRHYTGAETPGIERLDAIARQLKAEKAGASKLRAETIAALQAAYLASDWHRALCAYLEERGRANTEDELDALESRLGDVTRAISATPVRTPDDLVVRAAMAMHWYGNNEISNPSCTADHVLAAVVRGVLDLAGLKFDAEGRLLGEEPAAA